MENNKGINVLSLFDGLSGGRVALERAGIEVDKYYSAEIDKYAIQIADKNYPQDKPYRLGDVTKWQDWDIDWSSIDLVTGGSPCQSWSVAGKQLGDRDERGMLFWTMLDIMKKVLEHNPRAKFLIENVKMKKEFEEYITLHTTQALGTVYKHLINSALVSAQNRQRYYWTNIEGIEQPEDKGILLRDIVHENESIDTVLNGNHAEFQLGKKYSSLSPEKAITMTARQYASWNSNYWFETLSEYIVPFDKTLQILDKEVQRGKVGYFRKDSQANRVYYIHDKAVTLTGEAGGEAVKRGQYLFGHTKKNSQGNRVYGEHEKSCTLNASSGGTAGRGNMLFGCITPDRVNKRQNGQRFNDGKKFYTLTAQDKHGVLIGGYIRKLTPIECERLQTVPDNYTEGVSNAQRYKMLGNGWTVDVIAHIFKAMKGRK